MAMATSTCLRLPVSTPSSTKKIIRQLPRNKSEELQRGGCSLAMVSLLVALEIVTQDVGKSAEFNLKEPEAVASSSTKVSRWSSKRACPQWRLNSLEIIVPENLPRPSTLRKWEVVSNSDQVTSSTQPQGSRCFYL